MSLAGPVVWEGVDDAERRRAEPNREPWLRVGFLLDKRERRDKKFLDCAFFAGLGLEPYQQCLSSHGDLPSRWWMTAGAESQSQWRGVPALLGPTVPTGRRRCRRPIRDPD